MAEQRQYDLVLYGATGFTGQLVAEYLSQHAPKELKWAIAGRNPEKLEGVLQGLSGESRPETLVANSQDQSSIDQMAVSTKVIATTVGPYVKYGEPLVAACAEHGTDYLDITGEPAFVAMIQEKYHQRAKESGAALVSCCGFDSIPADLGTFYAVHHLAAEASKTVRCYVKSNGSTSGGTWASAVEAMSTLSKQPKDSGRRSSDQQGERLKVKTHRNPLKKGWALPLPLIDTSIVKHSARNIAQYGKSFQFGHYLQMKNLAQIAMLVGGVSAVVALANIPALKTRLLAMKPSGDGPSQEQRDKTFFKLTFIAEGGGQKVISTVSGGDPGYSETSKMLAESALLMALNKEKGLSGYNTPAQAFGMNLVERLNDAGMRFEVVSSTPQPA